MRYRSDRHRSAETPTITRASSASHTSYVADFQASFQPGNDSACPSRMFVLEQPQCAGRPFSPTIASYGLLPPPPLSPIATHRPSIYNPTPEDGGGGGGGRSSSGERAPFWSLWCVQMVVHREITRDCAQLHDHCRMRNVRPTGAN